MHFIIKNLRGNEVYFKSSTKNLSKAYDNTKKMITKNLTKSRASINSITTPIERESVRQLENFQSIN